MSCQTPPDPAKSRKVLGDPFRHIWLTRKVAEGAGIDLDGALGSGDLTKQTYAAMVTRCRAAGCDRPCALHVQAGMPDVPEFCANGELLQRLQGL